MRRFQRVNLGALLVALGIAGCEFETSARLTPQAQVQTAAEPKPRAATAAAPTTANEALRVRKVIDGDTITVSGVGTVRLLGVDAPEKTGGYREAERYGD